MSSDLRIQFTAAPAALRIGDRVRGAAERAARRPRRQNDAPAGQESEERAAPAPKEADPAPRGVVPDEAPKDGPPPGWALQVDRFDRIMTRLEAEATRLPKSVGEAITALEPDLIRLALAAASRVLRRKIEEGDEGGAELARLIGEAIQRITRGIEATEPVRVLVHPGDHEALSAAVGARANVDFTPDTDRAPGTVEVRCGMRRISVDVVREIDRLADRLLGDGGRDEGSDA